jgi:hypothetical protein
MGDKSEAKAWNPARIVMLVLLGIVLIAGTLILALNVMTYVQMKNAMNWSPYTDITQEDKDRYASLVMIPEISDQIVASNLRGIRDPQYCIETKTYDSIEELYKILPFETEEDRAAAIAQVYELDYIPDIPDASDAVAAYVAADLPLTEQAGNGYVVSYYYTHENYIIQDDEGFRLVFLVQTN